MSIRTSCSVFDLRKNNRNREHTIKSRWEVTSSLCIYAFKDGERLKRLGTTRNIAVLAEELKKKPIISKELAEFPRIKFFEFEVA